MKSALLGLLRAFENKLVKGKKKKDGKEELGFWVKKIRLIMSKVFGQNFTFNLDSFWMRKSFMASFLVTDYEMIY